MAASTLMVLIIVGIILALLAGIVYAITSKSGTKHSGSYASMVAFHDMQPKDKQIAIEIVMEQKEEKKLKEQESGEGKKDSNEP